MMSNRIIFLIGKILLFNVFLVLVSFFTLNTIIGSTMHFSVMNMSSPLIGLYGGFSGIFILYFIRFFIKSFFFGGAFLSIHSLYLPSVFAAAYFARISLITRFIVPLSCIVLFNLHPVGHCAWYYSLYWLIPLILYYAPQRNIIAQAIASTFIAHAVGSVVWVYCLPMSAEMFTALMPIVPLERAVFATGTMGMYYSMEWARELFFLYQEAKKTSGVLNTNV
jgi:hypothetical protein